MFSEDYSIMTALQNLKEDDLRRLIRAFLAKRVSEYNVQPLHGTGEHGKDTIATVDKTNDPLGRTQILLIQVKTGDISLGNWVDKISGQMLAAFCTVEKDFPRETSRDNLRRLVLFTNGELKPEAFKSVQEWNRTMPIPVEVFDIWGLLSLFKKYGVRPNDFQELLSWAQKLAL